jgi:hypothetical protein
LDPETNLVRASVRVKNCSGETVAFKAEFNPNDGYIIEPELGTLAADCDVRVTLTVDESVPLRDIDQDKFTLCVAPYDALQDPDLELFFSETFDSHDKLERRLMNAELSEAARTHVTNVAQTQHAENEQVEKQKKMKQVLYPFLGALSSLFLLWILLTDVCDAPVSTTSNV